MRTAYHEQLDALNTILGEMCELAGAAMSRATQALLQADLSVAEAVMQMELAHAPVLVFRNEKGGAINVVYRREDGNIGWIDPRAEAGAAPAQG